EKDVDPALIQLHPDQTVIDPVPLHAVALLKTTTQAVPNVLSGHSPSLSISAGLPLIPRWPIDELLLRLRPA
nr:hypothetical protein [Tanacetum cinerariifolium]